MTQSSSLGMQARCGSPATPSLSHCALPSWHTGETQAWHWRNRAASRRTIGIESGLSVIPAGAGQKPRHRSCNGLSPRRSTDSPSYVRPCPSRSVAPRFSTNSMPRPAARQRGGLAGCGPRPRGTDVRFALGPVVRTGAASRVFRRQGRQAENCIRRSDLPPTVAEPGCWEEPCGPLE